MDKVQKSIIEKQQQIDKLRKEIKELRKASPKHIANAVNSEVYYYNFYTNEWQWRKVSNSEMWKYLRLAIIQIWRERHKGQALKESILTSEEIKISAQLADKMLDAYNEFAVEVSKIDKEATH